MPNLSKGSASNILSEDTPDDLCFRLIDYVVPVGIFRIAEHGAGAKDHLTVLELLLVCPLDIGAHGTGFLLGYGRKDGQEHLAAGRKCIDVLILEADPDAELFQLPDVAQRIHCVAREAADGFGQDFIDFPGTAVCDHTHEFWPLFCTGAADPWIGINPAEFPGVVCLDQSSIMFHLPLVAVFLLLFLCRYARIGGYYQLFGLHLDLYWRKEIRRKDPPHDPPGCHLFHLHASFLFQPFELPGFPFVYDREISTPLQKTKVTVPLSTMTFVMNSFSFSSENSVIGE